jgi:long-chain acyl-CoA synthetase
MIIAGGVNIYPAEIEGEISAHPQVADVAVFGIPHPDMGEQIKAVVEPVEGVAGDDALRASIMEHIEGRLAKFKWPRSIDFVDELPREPTGKLLKRKLRDPYWADRETAI